MSKDFTTIYIPIETFNKLQSIQTKLAEILDKKPPLYKVIEILIALQLNENEVE